MIEYIKENKILISIILLLLVGGLYMAMLNCQEKKAEPIANQTPTQQVNIDGSNGFSVNGDVTNNKIITTTNGNDNEIYVPSQGSVPSKTMDVDKSGDETGGL